jgi:predicted AlkP superfamily phosphohydrolase/phosphomutase
MKKLYLIGIDSAALWIIEELRSKNMARGFRHFADSGTLCGLESTLPPITAAAWPTIYTGKNPEVHGVTNFFSLGPDYERQVMYYDTSRHPPFWNALAQHGIKSLVITPAMIVGLDGASGVDLITGFPLRPKFSSPKLEAMASKLGFHGEPEIEKDLTAGSMSLEEATRRYTESVKKRAEIASKLIKSNDYGFVFVCFTETDRIQHYTLAMKDWKEYVAPVYEAISDFIEWTAERANSEGDDSALMLVSDHGAQPIRSKFLLNSWLVKNGFAKISTHQDSDSGGYAPGQEVAITLNYVPSAKQPKSDKRKGPKTAEREGARFICASFMDSEPGGERDKVSLDMEATQAFASLSNDPVSNIWINDGRFARGTVKMSERAALIDRITKKLMEMKTEEGNKLVGKVIEGKSYYTSSTQMIMPDLLVELAEGYTIEVFNYSDDEVLVKPERARSGDHTRNGVFGFCSKKESVQTTNLSVLDLAPTVLDYYGIKGAGFAGRSRLKKV